MGRNKDEADAERKSNAKKGKTRGAANDFEMLKVVVSENRGLYLRVMEKLRALRGLGKESLFDVASNKQKQKISSSRNKRNDG